MKKIIKIFLKETTLTIIFLVAIFVTSSIAYSWQEPSGAPPTGNISAPLNQGATTQTKSGALNITGNLGVGTSNPSEKLEVLGNVKATAFIGDGSQLTGVSGGVTLAGQNYLSLSGQQITANAVNIASSHITGTLPVGNGGTGATTFTAGRILFGNTASALNTSANLFWDNTNSRLGIGTASPARLLHLSGSSAEMQFTDTDTSKSWHLGVTSADNFAIVETGVATRLTVANTTGNVGIGTAVPASPLDVSGELTLRGDYRQINAIPANNLFDFNIKRGTTVNANIGFRYGRETIAGTGTFTSIWYAGDGANSPIMTLDHKNTRLGIGTASTAYTLDVNGNAIFRNKAVAYGASPSTVYDGQLTIQGSETTGAVNTGGALYFAGHDGSTGRGWGYIRGMKENATSGNSASYLSFGTRVAGGDLAEKMRITSTGDIQLANGGTTRVDRFIGILANSAISTLKTVGSTSGAFVSDVLSLGSSNSSGGYGGWLELRGGSGYMGGGSVVIYGGQSDDSDGGSVYIYGGKGLENNSDYDGRVYIADNGTDKQGYIISRGTYDRKVGATNRDVYVDSGGTLGYVSSSLRYKDNVEDMGNVSWLYNLRPVNFNYKSDEKKLRQYGLIAEEVENINSDFVFYNDKGEVEGVSYSNFIPVLIKTVQEQKKEIEELKERIEELEKLVNNN